MACHCLRIEVEPKDIMQTTMESSTVQQQLDLPYRITPDQQVFFRTNGYIKLKHVLSADVLEHYGNEITDCVKRLNTQTLPMSQRNTYQRAFLQIMNIWRKSEIVRQFVYSKRLAHIAADLMGVRGVRLYHDQALYKEPSGGFTPWHADQYYWPLSNPNTCTVWIPLQATPLEMGPLAFAARSQNMTFGRDLEISDESEKQIEAALQQAKYPLDESPFDLGEVSYHSGWTYHRAGPNGSTLPRRVMTIIYMEDGIRLLQPVRKAHESDWKAWMPNAAVGQAVDTPLNPILYRT